jgi:transposase-like protein
MTQHLKAGYRELTPTRRGGYYQRNLLTPAVKIERLEVPRDREGESRFSDIRGFYSAITLARLPVSLRLRH